MARGRHRKQALHRVLLPASLAALALASAGAAWLVGDEEALILRSLTAVAALAAVAAAVALRRWDLAAGRQVARERAGRAGLAWKVEERQAELEEAQELVATLEAKVTDKRAELGKLRSEHAALLRRYATAESERAKALEGRRLLALEAAEPAKALPARAADHRTAGGAPTPLTYRQAYEALSHLSRHVARQRAEREALRPAPEPQALQPPPQRTAGFDFFGRAR
ncbi:hypothetical protein FH609_019540 [Streptomyces sp. 3MP-14]|uniref:Secreted protein n=1 Tax=Streptomyces mimosae TaxID=2586635 RepID=A0A5N6A6H7_9ACTN|nr:MULTISPECIES: hypothetical protein [Streptomyces]KAB8163842.1 hypothetical protein FH607_018080 [Streptomyces mimosae]KAB8175285.1 hypothetical protein FH609_019540 [Streptomyces sp. 3MP-14]